MASLSQYRKQRLWTKQLFMVDMRPDDKEVEVEYEHKTLFSFLK